MPQPKIKSCPFCGSTKLDFYRTTPRTCWVACARRGCLTAGRYHPTRAGAIRLWNRRAKLTTTRTTFIYDNEASELTGEFAD